MSPLTSVEDIDATISCLKTGTVDIRRVSAALLGECAIDIERDQVIAALIAALADEDAAVRLEAAHALRYFGAGAVTALISALSDSRPQHREAIVQTLGLLAREVPAAANSLRNLREDPAHTPLVDRAFEIARREPVDWKRWVDTLAPWILVCGIILGIVDEALTWLGVISWRGEIALKVALGWGLIGALGGAVIGAGWAGRKGMHWTAKQMGILGAIAGGFVGRSAASLLLPLLDALGQ